MPTTILTTRATARATPGAPDPEFQSMTWHGETAAGSGEYVVKIFSLAPVTDAWVESAIGEAPGWLLRKEWDSYPVLARTASFPPVEPIRGMQYLAALEPWISTYVFSGALHVCALTVWQDGDADTVSA
jgi:prenylcysteine oxidase/farnesylcysteine lyase